MSSAETGKMFAVGKGKISVAQTGQMSAVATRRMYSVKKGQRPVSTAGTCLVPTVDIRPV